MTSEQSDRTMLGWSREQLAHASRVSVAAVYLFERMGTAGAEDDARIRNALAKGKIDSANLE
jgi:transcriptional regulator with XRE-family HTH domain